MEHDIGLLFCLLGCQFSHTYSQQLPLLFCLFAVYLFLAHTCCMFICRLWFIENGLKLAKFPRVLVYWWISSISVWMPRCLVNVTANVECVKLNLKYSHWLLMPVIICCPRICLCYSTVWQTLIVMLINIISLTTRSPVMLRGHKHLKLFLVHLWGKCNILQYYILCV